MTLTAFKHPDERQRICELVSELRSINSRFAELRRITRRLTLSEVDEAGRAYSREREIIAELKGKEA